LLYALLFGWDCSYLFAIGLKALFPGQWASVLTLKKCTANRRRYSGNAA